MSSGLYNIEKLDDDNFDGWSVQMKSVLVHSELWPYVSGATPKPSAANELAEWVKKDEKALATIMLSIKTTQLLHTKKLCNIGGSMEKAARGPSAEWTST